jgi:hypothetical protein
VTIWSHVKPYSRGPGYMPLTAEAIFSPAMRSENLANGQRLFLPK